MTDPNEVGPISAQIERYFPVYRDQDEETLLAEAGRLALVNASFAAPLSRAALVALGRGLVGADDRIREVVCTNKDIISTAIHAINVSALVALVAPTLGFPPTAVPAAVVALAVLLLKIGLNQYCKPNGESSSV